MNNISIIIPILNEEQTIEKLLRYLISSSNKPEKLEIIVVDGGSTDNSKKVVSKFDGIMLLQSEKGRAKQMNLGAKHASGNILYFLHADSFPPQHFDQLIVKEFNNGNTAGCFRMKFDSNNIVLRISQWFTRFNFKICRGGDQSLYICKTIFERLKGYNEKYKVYEDCELIYRLYDHFNFKIIKDYITTSARRYKNNGALILQYHFAMIHFKNMTGAKPEALYNYYKKNIS